MELYNNTSYLVLGENTSTSPKNLSCSKELSDGVIYWALNCYGVDITSLSVTLILMVIGFTIVFLNSVAALAVVQRPEVENPSDLLIASLALADLIVGIFLIYQSAYNLGNWQIFHECLFRLGILLGAGVTSGFHLCFMTVDRYIKITRPFLYPRIFTKATIVGVSVVLWITSILLGISPVFGWNNGAPPPTETQCLVFLVLPQDYNLLIVFLCLIPFTVNIILYGQIFIVAQKHAKAIADQQTAITNIARPSSGTWKFTKTVCILMGFYFFCWMPFGIYILLEYSGHLDYLSLNEKSVVIPYLGVPAYINSMVNPIIYAVKIPYVKQRFAQMFRTCCCLRKKSRTCTATSRYTHSTVKQMTH